MLPLLYVPLWEVAVTIFFNIIEKWGDMLSTKVSKTAIIVASCIAIGTTSLPPTAGADSTMTVARQTPAHDKAIMAPVGRGIATLFSWCLKNKKLCRLMVEEAIGKGKDQLQSALRKLADASSRQDVEDIQQKIQELIDKDTEFASVFIDLSRVSKQVDDNKEAIDDLRRRFDGLIRKNNIQTGRLIKERRQKNKYRNRANTYKEMLRVRDAENARLRKQLDVAKKEREANQNPRKRTTYQGAVSSSSLSGVPINRPSKPIKKNKISKRQKFSEEFHRNSSIEGSIYTD